MDSQFSHSIGSMDLMILDQILKGNLHEEMKVMEVGCGYGKNLAYFLANGVKVSGIDKNEEAISYIRSLLQQDYPHYDPASFQCKDILSPLEQKSTYDAVLAIALLHQIPASEHATALHHMWQMLKEEGVLIMRTYVRGIGKEFSLSDKTLDTHDPEWEALLAQLEGLGGSFYEPANVMLSKANRPVLTAYLMKK
ncbi:MAG: class I SAM-dependent methyltransferase [Bacteroidota bacterium]